MRSCHSLTKNGCTYSFKDFQLVKLFLEEIYYLCHKQTAYQIDKYVSFISKLYEIPSICNCYDKIVF